MTVDSLEYDLARAFRAMAAEVDADAAERVTDAVLAATPIRRPAWRRPRVLALGAAGLAAAATAAVVVSLGSDDATDHGRPPQNAGCAAAYVFSGNTYVALMGREVGTVDPGPSLGTAMPAECSDGAPALPAEEGPEIFELSDVPPEQAVVVVDGENRGTVFVNVEEPATGWDPDLQALFDQWDVDR